MADFGKPDNAAPTKYVWQNDVGSGENPGVTGVFGAAPISSVDSGADPVGNGSQEQRSTKHGEIPGSAPQAGTSDGREGLQEPIVHNVVLGGNSATTPVNLLGLLRTNSAKPELTPGLPFTESQGGPPTAAFQPVPPSRSPSGQGSEGFTQLLHALSGDSSTVRAVEQPEAAKQVVVRPDSSMVGMETGFTSLLRTLNPDDRRDRKGEPPGPQAPQRSSPTAEGAGGFTALLQGFSGVGPDSGERQPTPKPIYENPDPISPSSIFVTHTVAAKTSGSEQAPPGAFTQLFRALSPEATNPDAANASAGYPEHNRVSLPSGDETSFSQIISTIGEGPYKPSTSGDEPVPTAADYSHRPSLGRENASGSSQLQDGTTDWSRTAAPQSVPSSRSGGLTQLLQTLDEPTKASEAPVVPPFAGLEGVRSQEGGSLFTETYRKLDEPVELHPPAPTPSYPPASRLSATQPYPSPFIGGNFPNQRPSAPALPDLPGGPSDVTRILDASKLREMKRQGAAVPGPISPVEPVKASPAQIWVQAPPITPPNLQWQPLIPPTPAQAQPTPAPQMPVAAAPPISGKMQQYLPLLLIIIIFLLILILVTVVFLLKH